MALKKESHKCKSLASFFCHSEVVSLFYLSSSPCFVPPLIHIPLSLSVDPVSFLLIVRTPCFHRVLQVLQTPSVTSQAVSSMGVLKGFQPTEMAWAQVSESAVCHVSVSRDYCSWLLNGPFWGGWGTSYTQLCFSPSEYSLMFDFPNSIVPLFWDRVLSCRSGRSSCFIFLQVLTLQAGTIMPHTFLFCTFVTLVGS